MLLPKVWKQSVRNSSTHKSWWANLSQEPPPPHPTSSCFSIESAWIKGNKRPGQTPGRGGGVCGGVGVLRPLRPPRCLFTREPQSGCRSWPRALHAGLFAEVALIPDRAGIVSSVAVPRRISTLRRADGLLLSFCSSMQHKNRTGLTFHVC